MSLIKQFFGSSYNGSFLTDDLLQYQRWYYSLDANIAINKPIACPNRLVSGRFERARVVSSNLTDVRCWVLLSGLMWFECGFCAWQIFKLRFHSAVWSAPLWKFDGQFVLWVCDESKCLNVSLRNVFIKFSSIGSNHFWK